MGEHTRREAIGAALIPGYEFPDELGRAGLMAWAMGLEDNSAPGMANAPPQYNVRAVLARPETGVAGSLHRSEEYSRYEASTSSVDDYRIAPNPRSLHLTAPNITMPNVIASPQSGVTGPTIKSEFTRYEESGSSIGNYSIASNKRPVEFPPLGINARNTGTVHWPGEVRSPVKGTDYARQEASGNIYSGDAPKPIPVKITSSEVNVKNTGAIPAIGSKGKAIRTLEFLKKEAIKKSMGDYGNVPNPFPVKTHTPNIATLMLGGSGKSVWGHENSTHEASGSSRDYANALISPKVEVTSPDISTTKKGAIPRTGVSGKQVKSPEYKILQRPMTTFGDYHNALFPPSKEIATPDVSIQNAEPNPQSEGAGKPARFLGYPGHKRGTVSIADIIADHDRPSARQVAPESHVIRDIAYPPHVDLIQPFQTQVAPREESEVRETYVQAPTYAPRSVQTQASAYTPRPVQTQVAPHTQSQAPAYAPQLFNIVPAAGHNPAILNRPQPQFDDLALFYIAYTYLNDRNRAAAFLELRCRGWRHNKVHDYWMRQLHGLSYQPTDVGENGTYLVYGTKQLHMEQLWLAIDYSQLDP